MNEDFNIFKNKKILIGSCNKKNNNHISNVLILNIQNKGEYCHG